MTRRIQRGGAFGGRGDREASGSTSTVVAAAGGVGGGAGCSASLEASGSGRGPGGGPGPRGPAANARLRATRWPFCAASCGSGSWTCGGEDPCEEVSGQGKLRHITVKKTESISIVMTWSSIFFME